MDLTVENSTDTNVENEIRPETTPVIAEQSADEAVDYDSQYPCETTEARIERKLIK